jgi:hypothetical protein
MTAHVAGMHVYNTNTAGSGTTAVSPGVYYNDGTQWRRVANPLDFWSLTGNASTDTTINFVGTTDNKSLMFKINSTSSGIIGVNNTALGYQALQQDLSTTSGQFNTAFGSGALATVNKGQNFGNNNTAVGYNALNKNDFTENVAVGSGALATNVSNADNVAVGYNAGNLINSSANTIVGSRAMASGSTAGAWNTAFGFEAIRSNISGGYNNAFGASALRDNTTGSNNIAVGSNALQNNTSGNFNVVIGQYAGAKMTTGSKNIIIGAFQDSVNAITTSSPSASWEMNIGNTIFGTSIDSAIGAGKIGINTRTPATTLDVKGSLSLQFTSLTSGSAYTVTPQDYYILCKTGGNLTIQLPAAAAATGRELVIRAAGTLGSTVTITAGTGDGIDNYASPVLSIPGGTLCRLVSDGANTWYKL